MHPPAYQNNCTVRFESKCTDIRQKRCICRAHFCPYLVAPYSQHTYDLKLLKSASFSFWNVTFRVNSLDRNTYDKEHNTTMHTHAQGKATIDEK